MNEDINKKICDWCLFRFYNERAMSIGHTECLEAWLHKDALREQSRLEQWLSPSIAQLEQLIEWGESYEKSQQAEAKFGEEVRKFYEELCGLRLNWTYYCLLRDSETFRKLGSMYNVLCKCCFASAVLGFTKLVTDEHKKKSPRTLTIRRLILDTASEPDRSVLLSKWEAIFNSPIANTMKNWRDKQLAHLDWCVVSGQVDSPTGQSCDIENAIKELCSLFKLLGEKVMGCGYFTEVDHMLSFDYAEGIIRRGFDHLFLSQIGGFITGDWARGKLILDQKVMDYIREHKNESFVQNLAKQCLIDLGMEELFQ